MEANVDDPPVSYYHESITQAAEIDWYVRKMQYKVRLVSQVESEGNSHFLMALNTSTIGRFVSHYSLSFTHRSLEWQVLENHLVFLPKW